MSAPEGLRFPDVLVYRGYSAPSRIEASVYDLEVDGTIPAELNGTYFRACADPQYPPLHGTDIFINGDGMIHKIAIANSTHGATVSTFISITSSQRRAGCRNSPTFTTPRPVRRHRSRNVGA